MKHSPDYRVGGILKDVATRDLKPGDAFESGDARVLSAIEDFDADQVTYVYEWYDDGTRYTNSLTSDAGAMHLVRRRPPLWSPLIILSLAVRMGVRLGSPFERFKVFSRADQHRRR